MPCELYGMIFWGYEKAQKPFWFLNFFNKIFELILFHPTFLSWFDLSDLF